MVSAQPIIVIAHNSAGMLLDREVKYEYPAQFPFSGYASAPMVEQMASVLWQTAAPI